MIQILVVQFLVFFHPFYVSLAEIKFNPGKSTLEISCRIFTDDFEKALRASKLGLHDLNHPKNTIETEFAIDQYINQHFYIEIEGKRQKLKMIGFEVEGDACWNYFEISLNKNPIGKIHIHDDILSEAHNEEINLVRYIHGDKNQNTKLENSKWDYFPEP